MTKPFPRIPASGPERQKALDKLRAEFEQELLADHSPEWMAEHAARLQDEWEYIVETFL